MDRDWDTNTAAFSLGGSAWHDVLRMFHPRVVRVRLCVLMNSSSVSELVTQLPSHSRTSVVIILFINEPRKSVVYGKQMKCTFVLFYLVEQIEIAPLCCCTDVTVFSLSIISIIGHRLFSFCLFGAVFAPPV